MPIITTTAAKEPAQPIRVSEVGNLTVIYYDPSGVAWPLTVRSKGWYTMADGVSGLGAAPVTLTSDAHPRGGARLRHVQPEPRSIVWPLHVYGATQTEFIGRWRALARAFTDTLRKGPGTLEVARMDGTRRRISVYYQEGFEGRADRTATSTFDFAVLTLWCEDPYFYDANPQVVHREYGTGEDFLQPYPSVSSGQVLGATTVNNEGDVVVWPEWRITGPASLITFTNEDTGEQFVLDPTKVGHGNLLAGETVTVTTDPPRVRYMDGSNWIGTLDWPGANLWGLQPGSNNITFQLDGSGPGSAVDLSYHPRYETA